MKKKYSVFLLVKSNTTYPLIPIDKREYNKGFSIIGRL